MSLYNCINYIMMQYSLFVCLVVYNNLALHAQKSSKYL